MGALQPLTALGVLAGSSGEGSGTGQLHWSGRQGVWWGLGLGLSVFPSSWPLEVKIQGSVRRMGLVLFFKARFPGRREKEEGSALCQPSGLSDNSSHCSAGCPLQETSELATGTAAISRSGQHCRGEGLPGPSLAPSTNLPFSCGFFTSM